jgi:hypothetical protein
MKFNLIIFSFMMGVLLYSSQQAEAIPKFNIHAGEVTIKATPEKIYPCVDAQGLPCLRIFEIKCLNGAPLVVGIGEIVEPLDTVDFCQKKAQEGILDQNFGIDECADRLDVLYKFKNSPTVGNKCVTQRW